MFDIFKSIIFIIIVFILIAPVAFGDFQDLAIMIRKIDFETGAQEYLIENGEIKVVYGILEIAREKYKRKLTPKELTFLKIHIQSCKIETLKESYINPEVEDGYQVIYQIRFNGRELNIRTYNVYQPTLISICEKINTFLPEIYQLEIPSTAEHHKDLMN